MTWSTPVNAESDVITYVFHFEDADGNGINLNFNITGTSFTEADVETLANCAAGLTGFVNGGQYYVSRTAIDTSSDTSIYTPEEA